MHSVISPDRFCCAHDLRRDRFAKWREVHPISPQKPTCLRIEANAEMLARYAAVCQEEGFVPIVEPEVLIDSRGQGPEEATANLNSMNALFPNVP